MTTAVVTVGRLRLGRVEAWLIVLLLAGILLLAGSMDRAAGTEGLVLLSGRDDHGVLVHETVAVLAAPAAEGEEGVLGHVPDGELVHVVGDDGGSWLRVRTLDGLLTGWVDTFHARGQVHAVAASPACPVPMYDEVDGRVLDVLRPSEQVRLLDHHIAADGADWVGVATLRDDRIGLLPAAQLQELPGPMPTAGGDCRQVRPDPEAVPHQH